MDNTDYVPDRTAELKLAKAVRRVEQYDREKIEEICGCMCRRGWCYPCAFVMLQPPPVSEGKTNLSFGANTPEGE